MINSLIEVKNKAIELILNENIPQIAKIRLKSLLEDLHSDRYLLFNLLLKEYKKLKLKNPSLRQVTISFYNILDNEERTRYFITRKNFTALLYKTYSPFITYLPQGKLVKKFDLSNIFNELIKMLNIEISFVEKEYLKKKEVSYV